ncbi:MAG: DUF4293 domain-containing protein [Bacteroidales bacterium]|nr:DUF4293 domain-containing protein [Bacteroidales bacterium]
MIQRAQSVYLFLVVVLMSFYLIFPIITFGTGDEMQYRFFSYALKKTMDGETQKLMSSWPLFFLVLVIAGISFYTIFLFHRRMVQMRLCVYNILLLIGLLGLTYFYFRFIQKSFEVTHHAFKIGIIFPVLCIALSIMAFSGIRRDELLVKTYERLRK